MNTKSTLQTPAAQADTHSAADLAKRIGISLRQVRRMDADGTLPQPVRFGKLKRWTRLSIDAWLAAGCPKRKPGKSTTQSA
jgi:predicted DNA-binding transcriptional regulator AlpA